MSQGSFRPKARQEWLLVEPLDQELLVFDAERNRAHSLNAAAAKVWRACDGQRGLPELQAHCGLDEVMLLHALDVLRSNHLLEESGLPDGVSRRAMLRRSMVAGAGLGVAVPIVRSITAPTAAMAASVRHKGKALQACTEDSQCTCSVSLCHSGSQLCRRVDGASCSHNSSCSASICSSGDCVVCFIPDTEVLMADGTRLPIGLLRVGDQVLARDEHTGDTDVCSVSQVFRHLVDQLLVLGLDSGEQIHTTAMHPFATPEGRFVEAGSLQPGAVLAAQGQSSTLLSATPRDGRHEVFNLEVDGLHTYFVGDDRLWVHNKGPTNPCP
jgi:hypothetical protein